MVEAAEFRKAHERRHQANLMAVAFNEPKRLDEVAPRPGRPARAQASEPQQFVEEQWW